ncbi:MAG: hypothetical protein HY315_05870 [Acidobacteria bacterium]|nr:hypothetical protein [Acidobacteriota bacterium]
MERNVVCDLEPRFAELSPERRLAAAVVRLAWEDTFAETGAQNPLRAGELRKRREAAIRWILHDQDFIYWCEMSTMNARAVRARFESELARQRIES